MNSGTVQSTVSTQAILLCQKRIQIGDYRRKERTLGIITSAPQLIRRCNFFSILILSLSIAFSCEIIDFHSASSSKRATPLKLSYTTSVELMFAKCLSILPPTLPEATEGVRFSMSYISFRHILAFSTPKRWARLYFTNDLNVRTDISATPLFHQSRRAGSDTKSSISSQNSTAIKLPQFLNAPLSISITVEGILMCVRDVHSLNAPHRIRSRPSPSSTCTKL